VARSKEKQALLGDLEQIFSKHADVHYRAGKLEGLMLVSMMLMELSLRQEGWVIEFVKRWGEANRKYQEFTVRGEDGGKDV